MNREIKLLLLDRWRRSLLSGWVVAAGVCFFSAAMTVFNRTDMSALIAIYGGAALWSVAFGIQPEVLKVYRQLPIRRDDVDATGISIVLGAAGIVFLIMVPSTYCFDLLIDKRELFSPANCLATCSAAAALALVWALVQFALGGAESGGQILKSYAAMNAATRIVVKSGFLMLPLVGGYAVFRILGMNGPLQAFIYLTGAIGLAAGCRGWLPASAEGKGGPGVHARRDRSPANASPLLWPSDSPRRSATMQVFGAPLIMIAAAAVLEAIVSHFRMWQLGYGNGFLIPYFACLLLVPLEDEFASLRAYRSLPISSIRLIGWFCIYASAASMAIVSALWIALLPPFDWIAASCLFFGCFGIYTIAVGVAAARNRYTGALCTILLGLGFVIILRASDAIQPELRSTTFNATLCLAGASAIFGPWLLHRTLTRSGQPYQSKPGGNR